MGLFWDMLYSDAFVGGALGGILLGFVQWALTLVEISQAKISNTKSVHGALVVAGLLFATVGGVVAYFLSRDASTGAFIAGLTAMGFVALFLGDLLASGRSLASSRIRGGGKTNTAGAGQTDGED